ncbi:MAG: replicative DNA helicase, partial [Sphaerospermopsis kisseleviana]
MVQFDRPLTNADRMPPIALEEEERICSALLVNPDLIAAIANSLRPSHFYSSTFSLIYTACLELYNRQQAVDLVTVGRWLADNKRLDEIGGQTALVRLVADFDIGLHANLYAETIIEKYQRREAIKIGQMIQDIASNAIDWQEGRKQLISQFFELTQDVTHTDLVHVREIVPPEFDKIERRAQGLESPGMTCGFYDLDEMTQGFKVSDLVIVAGRPGSGKTAITTNIARNVARLHDVPVAIFSLEMSKEQLVNRLIATETRIQSNKLNVGNINESEWEKLGDAFTKISGLPIYIDDTANISVPEMRTKLMRLKQKDGLGLVIIDYLQLMEGASDNRVQELSKITRSLKRLARELNVPVITLSQLNRGVESRQNKRPVMSDLRECLTRSAMLMLADTGERKSIADIKPGMKVLAVNEQQKVISAVVSHVMKKGIKPVYRLTTKTGRVIECTDNHPIFTQRGYVQLRDLQSSDLIATALRMECPASSDDDSLKARLLGYLIGNGCMLNGISFCTPCSDVKDDFCNLVNKFFPGASFNIENKTGNCWEIDVAYHYVESYGKPFGNPLRNWVRALGLTGKRAPEKFCPEWVFTLGAKGAIEFLTGLLYTDGSVNRLKGDNFNWNITFDTSSKVLAADTLQLLSRAGIVAVLSKPSKKEKAHHHSMYRIAISEDSANLIQFARMVEKVGYKGRNLNLLIESLIEKDKQLSGRSVFVLPKDISALLNQKSLLLRQQGIKRNPDSLGVWRDQGKRLHREICDRYAKYLQDQELDMWANSDLLWEEVRSIEPIGEEETFDICVPETGNFLANGITV